MERKKWELMTPICVWKERDLLFPDSREPAPWKNQELVLSQWVCQGSFQEQIEEAWAQVFHRLFTVIRFIYLPCWPPSLSRFLTALKSRVKNETKFRLLREWEKVEAGLAGARPGSQRVLRLLRKELYALAGLTRETITNWKIWTTFNMLVPCIDLLGSV